MDWKTTISAELLRIHPGQHPGKIRATARRIAGIALQQIYSSSTADLLSLLQRASNDIAIPDVVRKASQRLSARLSPDFTSESTDPIGDAKIIVDYVKEKTG